LKAATYDGLHHSVNHSVGPGVLSFAWHGGRASIAISWNELASGIEIPAIQVEWPFTFTGYLSVPFSFD